MPRATPSQQAPTRRITTWYPLSDGQWPGRLVTVIELWGCTFECPWCAGERESRPGSDAPVWDEIVAHVSSNRERIEGIVVTGGEPLDDPDLPSLLAALAELGPDIRLETNGSRPDVLSLLIAEALVDSVVLDVKTVSARYREITGERDMPARVAECADMLIRSGINHEFRTTLDPRLVSVDDLTAIARTLRGGALYVVQRWWPAGPGDPEPFSEDSIAEAVAACGRFLPTVVRGFETEAG
jgi:pyruvate formate lyase activating enzyme